MKIKESISNNSSDGLVEDMLKRPDAFGKGGIDLFNEKGFEFVYGDEKADIGISKHGAKIKEIPKNKCILLKTEPPIYNIFFGLNIHKESFMKKYLAVMCDYVVDNFPVVRYNIPREFDLMERYPSRYKTDFLCMILKNKSFGIFLNSLVPSLHKYKKYNLMNTRKEFDKICCDKLKSDRYQSYGRGWDKRCFKGSLPKTGHLRVMSSHLFTLTTENSSLPGYVTEKMLYPMFCESIPIYLGAPDVEKYVPKGTFIDIRDFDKYEDVIDFIINMQPKQIEQYKKRIKKFVTSDQSYNFSSVTFAKKLVGILEGDVKK